MEQQTIDFGAESREQQHNSKSVDCLGITFENDEARRAHFTEELRKKLQAPDFRKIEGFPIGSDEDILNLSDPPYYTACPNPWIVDFIAEWEAQKPEQPEGYHYHREPFAADVSEGKNDPIYNAHSYHTKVPHKAIMRYILHYTQPGDIVFDGFCGTGMTGVAAQMCGDPEAVKSLGYLVKHDGTILEEDRDDDGRMIWKSFSKLGSRKALLNDLSPAATLIARNYNTPVSDTIKKEANEICGHIRKECGWMYETKHSNGEIGEIVFVLFSDLFICPECASEIVFWNSAVDHTAGKMKSDISCQHCGTILQKKDLTAKWVTSFDKVLGETRKRAVQIPVLIKYSYNGRTYEKEPDRFDLKLIDEIGKKTIDCWIPTNKLPDGSNTRQPALSHGLLHVHEFYTKRNLIALAEANKIISKKSPLSFVLSSMMIRSTVMNRLVVNYYFHGGGGANGAHLKGTLYVSSLPTETPVTSQMENKVNAFLKITKSYSEIDRAVISTNSSTSIDLPDCSLDYLFLDPPFGANINYSELNSIWESWIKVSTNNELEAIENSTQGKNQHDYRNLMLKCFREAFRILKAGRWMTVEFSNTKASVWNSIQTALTEAGFIVANVSALDKKQGSFKAVTTPTAVKQDLVISAYKPDSEFEERFQQEAQTEEGIWDFICTHLKYLPVTKQQGALLQFVPERDPRILFDQMVAYYVRNGYPVPISSQEFQAGLIQRFSERDGMFFLPEQVAEYDRKKVSSSELRQMTLFVSDETSAIQWLRQLLKDKPQTFSDINPQFMQQLGGWSKNESQLDLRELLEQNFLSFDGKGPVPEQIHSYLSTNWKELRNLGKEDPALVTKAKDRWYVPDPNKAGDLEKLRERALLKEFEEYKQAKKKLKVFRLEAVRAGFKKAWQERDYKVIITVAEKIPNNVLEEDPKLLMWFDQAMTRTSSGQ